MFGLTLTKDANHSKAIYRKALDEALQENERLKSERDNWEEMCDSNAAEAEQLRESELRIRAALTKAGADLSQMEHDKDKEIERLQVQRSELFLAMRTAIGIYDRDYPDEAPAILQAAIAKAEKEGP